ncbi:MAG: APC family permease [Anaerolineaceae bacterium]|nr:APC family permease [Anaerolineaceae bacterium]
MKDSSQSNLGTAYHSLKNWRTWLIGRPLPTADAPHQTIGKLVGLAVFASDALSSTAYATQEMLMILVLAGTAALHFSLPIALGIVILLTILTLSYEQTIHAYPDGGGAYIVARDNLGHLPALIAGAALLTDYILTVSVSISSGIAQIVSAFPGLYHFRIEIAVLMVFFIMIMNLRGVKESGKAFAVPTYFFLVMMFLTVGVGIFRYLTGSLGVVQNPPELELIDAAQPITFFLILRAFSNGTSAVTGVEAISNGITAFKEPRSRNAGIVLIWMSVILGSLMLAITFLAYQTGAVPSEVETVISQIARTIFGAGNLWYIFIISATTIILIMAANTAFADFPRLGAMIAGDGYLPRQFSYRGSRLVYSRGIIALAAIASGLIIIFNASVTNLIPLYAIGVFLSFSLSQFGMAHRWWKSGRLKPGQEVHEPGSILRYEHNWLVKMLVNGFGGLTTLVVMIVFAITKFSDGAWIIIILTPLLVLGFTSIRRHYRNVADQLTLDEYHLPAPIENNHVIFLVGGVHQSSLASLNFARTLSQDIRAVHVSIDPIETERAIEKWNQWVPDVPLIILESPYRLFIEPVLDYIDEVDREREPHEVITIVVPQFVTSEWRNLLHARTADTLRKVLLTKKDVVIIEVPYRIQEE